MHGLWAGSMLLISGGDQSRDRNVGDEVVFKEQQSECMNKRDLFKVDSS